MTSVPRRLALTAHVVSSVGWLGAVIAFLGLAVAAWTSRDPQTVRAAYLAMQPITWYVLVPLALASLLTGLVSSLGTIWGLFRHYWVVFKLVLTLVAAIVLLSYTQTINHIAEVASVTTASTADLRELGLSPLLHAGGGLVVLLATTVLGIFKPRGLTPYGWRKQRESRAR